MRETEDIAMKFDIAFPVLGLNLGFLLGSLMKSKCYAMLLVYLIFIPLSQFSVPAFVEAASKNNVEVFLNTKTSHEVDASSYGSLNAAVTANKEKNNVTIKVVAPTILTENLTVPSNISIAVADNGRIDQKRFTLRINSHFTSDSGLVFVGHGPVLFVIGSVDKVYPQWFGAKADGKHDDTQAIQAAISSAADGCNVYFAKSTYLISSTLMVENSKVVLDGAYSTLHMDDPSGQETHLQIGSGKKQVNGVYIKDLVFTRAQVASSGAALHLKYAGVCSVSDVRIFGDQKIYNGIVVDRGIMISLLDSYIQGTVNYGIYLFGKNSETLRTIDTRVDRCRIESCKVGIFAGDFVEGLYVRNNIIFKCSVAGLSYDAVKDKGRYSIKIQQNDFDTCGIGIYLQNCSNISIDGNWFSNNAAANIKLLQGVTTATINNNQAYAHSVNNNIEIYGKYVRMNGNIISGGAHGIYLGSSAYRVDLSGNSISNVSGFGLNSFENPEGFSITGNSFYGNVRGTIGDAKTPAERYIVNNTGYSSKASSILVGASPFTYKTGTSPESIYVYGGTNLRIVIDGIDVPYSGTISFVLPPQRTITFTYARPPYILSIRN